MRGLQAAIVVGLLPIAWSGCSANPSSDRTYAQGGNAGAAGAAGTGGGTGGAQPDAGGAGGGGGTADASVDVEYDAEGGSDTDAGFSEAGGVDVVHEENGDIGLDHFGEVEVFAAPPPAGVNPDGA